MIRLLTAALLFASFNVVAEVTLTPLNNNTPADADDVMGNFNALKEEIESLPAPPTNCTADQIIKWNGTAWVCSNIRYRETNCEIGPDGNMGGYDERYSECLVDCPDGDGVRTVHGSCIATKPDGSIAPTFNHKSYFGEGWRCVSFQPHLEVDMFLYVYCE